MEQSSAKPVDTTNQFVLYQRKIIKIQCNFTYITLTHGAHASFDALELGQLDGVLDGASQVLDLIHSGLDVLRDLLGFAEALEVLDLDVGLEERPAPLDLAALRLVLGNNFLVVQQYLLNNK